MVSRSVDVDEMIARGLCTAVKDDACGRIVVSRDCVFSDILDGSYLVKFAKENSLDHDYFFCVEGEYAKECIKEMLGVDFEEECSQYVYDSAEKLTVDNTLDIHLMNEEQAVYASQFYHGVDDNEAYLKEVCAEGHLWGLFEGDKLAGYIGVHMEGSIGMLEILPEFRRKGYGYALEAFLINWHLDNGYVPYCQVVTGNRASEMLQEKLGMTKTDTKVYWIG